MPILLINKAKHRFKDNEPYTAIDYFVVTLPNDPDYERYYKATAKKLRRNIISRYWPQDKTRLEITRIGTGKSTVYKMRAVNEDKLLVLPTNGKDYFEDVPAQQQHL